MEFRIIDLRDATDEQLAAFAFDRPVADESGKEWWWGEELEHADIALDPWRVVAFLTRLFREPWSLLDRFSAAEVNQGFWFLIGGHAEPGFRESLWSADVVWSARAACIAALPSIYAELWVPLGFREPDADLGAGFMIPDWLASDYDHGARTRAKVEDRRVQDALLSAFRAMLRADDHDTRKAGLHGIFHLVHPDGNAAVREFLEANPALDPDLRKYAENGLAGRWL